MNDLIVSNGKTAVTMTSRDIAELTGKQHQHVKRDIKNMLEALGKDPSSYGRIYKDAYGRDQEEYELDRELTMTLISGYDIPLRFRVVNRLAELEARPAINPMQVLNDPAAMRGLLLTYTEKVLTLESKVSELAPKAEALDRLALADGEVCLQTAGKLLQQPPNKFIAWLRGLGTWIFKRQGSARNSAYTDKINAGYLNVRTVTTIMPDGSERVTEQVVVTPKGLAKLAQMLGVTTIGATA